jgi:hypothetical protein
LITLIKQLNHRAKLIESNYGKIDVKEIVNTGMFNMENAKLGSGWLQDLHEMTVREVRGSSFPRIPPFSLFLAYSSSMSTGC